jgi:prepilin signal peptidase PulO-like enzyme (type II secretory pathway)
MLPDLFIFVLGLIFGSFITALSWRYPKNISVVKGRSFCPHCKKTLVWYDNVPLLSFLLLGGKCRYCKSKISPRYPLIELVTALGFLYIWTLGGSPFLIAYSLVVFLALLTVFVIDFEHQIIPDPLVFLLITLTLVKLVLAGGGGLYSNLLAGFLASSFLLLLNLVTKGRGMGLGDVKFAVWGGMFVGLDRFLLWFFAAFLTGALAGIILILVKGVGLKDRIAFGPFLIIALAITHFWGNEILSLIGMK